MKNQQKLYGLGLLIALIAGVFIGSRMFLRDDHTGNSSDETTIWTCSMHPQIQLPEPGLCPLCGMDLIPLRTGGVEDLAATEIKLSPHAQNLAALRVAPAERRAVEREIRMVGKVEYDESSLKTITSRVEGRLDRLYVDYTGIEVNKGDHLVYLYSPELISAQEEFLQARKTFMKMRGGVSAGAEERAGTLVASAREKLILLGLTVTQMSDLVTAGKTSDHLTIYSPVNGVVVEKPAREGMYVKVGSVIYTIADLDSVWLQLDAYESDLAWLRYGQSVSFESEAYPGEPFEGSVTFIDPILNAATSTVKVRVNVDNAKRRLKPGMFVRAKLKASVSELGQAITPDLAGKWLCPMHPEIVEEQAGPCSICEMDLVQADSLAKTSSDEALPLVIPATAPLITGTRAVVYVADPDRSGVYEGREITLGVRAGDYYVVEQGLQEGELVVAHGAFKIDSAMQLQAKPSMMSPQGGDPAPMHHHDHGSMKNPAKHENLSLDTYFNMQKALSEDALPDASGYGSIDEARQAFETMSQELIRILKTDGTSEPVYQMHCSMAFEGKGADWLQRGKTIANPYYGSAMLRCGSVKDSFVPAEK